MLLECANRLLKIPSELCRYILLRIPLKFRKLIFRWLHEIKIFSIPYENKGFHENNYVNELTCTHRLLKITKIKYFRYHMEIRYFHTKYFHAFSTEIISDSIMIVWLSYRQLTISLWLSCMCECVCVCVYVCMCVCVCVCVCVWMCENACVCVFVGFFLWLCVSASYRQLMMGWLRWVGSIKLQVSFAKGPYKRDYILHKRPRISSILLTVATTYRALVVILDNT